MLWAEVATFGEKFDGAIIVVTSERISLRVCVRSAITIIYFHKQSPVIGPRRLDPH